MEKRNKFKLIINFSVSFLLLGSLVLFFGNRNWWPGYYSPNYFSITFFSSAIIIILPKILLKAKDQCKKDSIILFQTVSSIALILNALGELGFYQLYKYGFQYDKVIHFTSSLLFVLALTSVIELWNNTTLKKALRLAIILVLIGSILWEFFEFFSDLIFKTSEFGVYGKYKLSDTIFDIIFDMIGVVIGIYIMSTPKLSKKIIGEYCRWPEKDS
jgi:asparagine N-glycosylation enzyme membrane subunit Stt3